MFGMLSTSYTHFVDNVMLIILAVDTEIHRCEWTISCGIIKFFVTISCIVENNDFYAVFTVKLYWVKIKEIA